MKGKDSMAHPPPRRIGHPRKVLREADRLSRRVDWPERLVSYPAEGEGRLVHNVRGTVRCKYLRSCCNPYPGTVGDNQVAIPAQCWLTVAILEDMSAETLFVAKIVVCAQVYW